MDSQILDHALLRIRRLLGNDLEETDSGALNTQGTLRPETDRGALHSAIQSELDDRFSLERELGRGGMAVVFLARDKKHDGRRVAVKVLEDDVALGPAQRLRFMREVATAARLSHPGIVPLFDSGEAGGRLYYVMPYVEGETLRERMAKGPLSQSEMMSLLTDVAGALDYAHERGIVHRDVKPENVLIASGRAMLADFGIARALVRAAQSDSDPGRGTVDETLTLAGAVIGTPAYMSPEQLAGNREIDGRSDQYSLACVAFEMLTGSRPFTGSSSEQLAQRFRAALPLVSDARIGLPQAVEGIVGRAFAVVPEDRFDTAGAFVRALGETLAERTDRRSGETVRPRRAGVGAAIAGGIAVAALAGVALWRSATAEKSPSKGPRPMLAVLPFKNIGQPENAYFSEGVTEEITSRLASLSGLGVISRTSADQYRSTSKTLRQVARELGVEYILEGSVRWDRTADSLGRVRVTPQLIRVSDDSHLWAEPIEASVADVFALQSRIAERIAAALNVQLLPPERDAVRAQPTQSFEAYNLVLRASDLAKHGDLRSVREAVRLLERAVQLDSAFVSAHIALYHARNSLQFFAGDTAEGSRAERSLATAERLAPDHAGVLVARGWEHALARRWNEAMEKFERAQRRAPNDAGILATIGTAQWRLGRVTEARRTMDRVLLLNPRDAQSAADAAALASWSRDFTASRRYMDRVLASDPAEAHWGAIVTDMLAWEGDSVATRRAAREAITRNGAGAFANQLALENPLMALSMLDSATVRELVAAAPMSAFADDSLPYYLFRSSAQRVLGDVSLQHVYADSARRVLEPRIRGPETSLYYRLWTLVRVQALLGRREALAVADRVDRLAAGDSVDITVARTARAVACALLGDADSAIPVLEELLAKPSAVSVTGLRTGPIWAPLRRDPRFQRLIASR